MDKMTQARCNLLLTRGGRWYSSILLSLKTVCTDEIPTAATDGKRLLYNPEFINGLSKEQLTFLLLHEVMHVALGHSARMKKFSDDTIPHELHNVAMDLAINSHPLLDTIEEIEKIKGGMYPDEFGLPNGKSYEWYLKELLERSDSESLQKQVGTGEVLPADEDTTIEQADAQLEQAVIGDERGDLAEQVGLRTVKKVDWRKQLKQFIVNSMTSGDNTTFNKINAHYSQDEFILPGSADETIEHLVVLVDTSGSCYCGPAQEFLAHIVDMTRQLRFKCTILQHDTEVTCETRVSEGGAPALEIRGGGGTDHRPALKRANQLNPTAIVSFTDMLSRFPERSRCPVLFVANTENFKDYYPKFGRVIHTN